MSHYVCPECGSDSKVVDTRPSYNRLRRRRVCSNKSHKFSTLEVPLDTPDQVSQLIRFALENHDNQIEDMIQYVQSQCREIMLGIVEEEEPIT